MSILRHQSRLFRRLVLEFLEDRRPVDLGGVGAIGSVLAVGGAAYAVMASQIQIVPQAPAPDVSDTTACCPIDLPYHVQPAGGGGASTTPQAIDVGPSTAVDDAFASWSSPPAAAASAAVTAPPASTPAGSGDGAGGGAAATGHGAVFTSGGSMSSGPNIAMQNALAQNIVMSSSETTITAPAATAGAGAAAQQGTVLSGAQSIAVPAPTAAPDTTSASPAATTAAPAVTSAAPAPSFAAPATSAASDLYNGGDFMQSAPGVGANQPDQFSSNPVRYFDGIVELSFTDLPADNSGLPTGLTRSWTNGTNYANGFNGTGMVVTQMPHLIQDGTSIDAVENGSTLRYTSRGEG